MRLGSKTVLERATVNDRLRKVTSATEVALNELTVHEPAIDESSCRKASTREHTFRKLTADEIGT